MPRKHKDDTRSVYDKALGLLARREHSARELKTKLALRGHEAAEASEAIERLRERSHQSDERFAGNLARQRAGQCYGPRRITAELRSHGLPDATIRATLNELEVDWVALALAQLRRRFGACVPADRVERGKRAAFLLRRGFDAATVRAVTHAQLDDSGPDAD